MVKYSARGEINMNFIFLSPNFPKTYFNFTKYLRNNGVITLGIGDEAYDRLSQECRDSLVEYYKVSTLENYDEVFRAVAYFAFKYGKIDWLESNNEYWLLRDAQLREDFNINTGLKNDRIDGIKFKSKMKKYYKMANVPTARYHMVSTLEKAKAFIEEVGYPVVVKPDNGVGAYATYKLKCEKDLIDFFDDLPHVDYIMEEYINGTIVSYDGICDSNKDIIFETSHYFPDPVMDLVNEQIDTWYYSKRVIPEDLKDAGRRVIKAFDSNSRFFHCEFFRLNEDKEGLGKKNDLLGLEVNMRPPGGYTPDMMNYANDINVYQIWANMVCYDQGYFDPNQRPYVCVYAAKRYAHTYAYSNEEIMEKYKDHIVMFEVMPEVLANAMGNEAFIARFKTEKEAISFAQNVLKKRRS